MCINNSIFRVLVGAMFFFLGLGTLLAQQFSLSIAENGRLQIFSSRGQKIDDLPQATIGKMVEVPPVVFEVSYGKDISNLLSIIISPSADRPTALNFLVGGRRIQMDAQAVVTLTFNADKTKLRIDPGYIGQVTVDGNPIVEEMEYTLIATSSPTSGDPDATGKEPEKQDSLSPSSASPTMQDKVTKEIMPTPPVATTTKITSKPSEEELPSLDEIPQDVPLSFLGDTRSDLDKNLPPASHPDGTQKPSATKTQPPPTSPPPQAPPRPKSTEMTQKDSSVAIRPPAKPPRQATPVTKPLSQGFRPNRPLAVSRIDLGNVHLESMLFAPRKGDLPRLAQFYTAKDKKTPLVYPENYVQTSSHEFAIAGAEQYPSRVFVVETFYWMEPVTPPNRALAPRIAPDKMALVEINGEVRVNTMLLPATKQQEVSSGALIETGTGSSVAVFIGGVNSMRLAENSSMRLHHKIMSGFREIIAEVDRGLIFVKVGQRVGEEQRLIIRTPKGVVEARGTDFAVWVDDEGTHVFLKSGQVNLMSGQAPASVLTTPEDPAGLSIGSLQKISADRLHSMVPIILSHLKTLNIKTNQILEKASRGLALQQNEKEYLQLIPTVDLITPVHRIGAEPKNKDKAQDTPAPRSTLKDRMLRDVKDRMRF